MSGGGSGADTVELAATGCTSISTSEGRRRICRTYILVIISHADGARGLTNNFLSNAYSTATELATPAARGMYCPGELKSLIIVTWLCCKVISTAIMDQIRVAVHRTLNRTYLRLELVQSQNQSCNIITYVPCLSRREAILLSIGTDSEPA